MSNKNIESNLKKLLKGVNLPDDDLEVDVEEVDDQ